LCLIGYTLTHREQSSMKVIKYIDPPIDASSNGPHTCECASCNNSLLLPDVRVFGNELRCPFPITHASQVCVKCALLMLRPCTTLLAAMDEIPCGSTCARRSCHSFKDAWNAFWFFARECNGAKPLIVYRESFSLALRTLSPPFRVKQDPFLKDVYRPFLSKLLTDRSE